MLLTLQNWSLEVCNRITINIFKQNIVIKLRSVLCKTSSHFLAKITFSVLRPLLLKVFFFGGGVDVLEVLSFNWQNLTYKREQNLARARNFVVCTLIKERDDKDRLDNDETPKVVISGATNGLIVLIINAVNCLVFKRQFFSKSNFFSFVSSK